MEKKIVFASTPKGMWENMSREELWSKCEEFSKALTDISLHFRSGNNIPVAQATIKAERFWPIYDKAMRVE